MCLSKRRWLVAVIGSLPFALWGAPHYVRLILDEATKYSLGGAYLDYVSNRLIVGTVVTLALTLAANAVLGGGRVERWRGAD
ncbi:MAG TPA: hypothetical protein VM142_08760 [Acidimicrobiales bacterium]|nr:hypothetical protein [Acidimicrobiales bacterium]